MNAAIFVYFRTAETAPEALRLFVKHNSNAFVFDRISFPKSQLFANINVFKLFDLLKSHLKYISLGAQNVCC